MEMLYLETEVTCYDCGFHKEELTSIEEERELEEIEETKKEIEESLLERHKEEKPNCKGDDIEIEHTLIDAEREDEKEV